MRIVHYYPSATIDSGVTLALWAWASALAERGVDVAVIHGAAGPEEGPQRQFAQPDGAGRGVDEIVVPHRGRGRIARYPLGLSRLLRSDDVMILHEGWVTSNLVAARTARAAGVPYVVMPHGVYERAWRAYLKPPVRVREWFERRLLEHALAVHVFFATEIADVKALAPRASTIAIPTGCVMPGERWVGGGGYVSWIGRIDPLHKGLDLLVEAVASMPPDERPTLRLHGYDYRGGLPMLQRLIDERGVRRWFDVRGVVSGSEKMTFLKNAEGYVHPSRWESQSIAILENLSLGVPSLISDTTHIATSIREGDAGLLVSPTADALATGLRRLLAEGPEFSDRGRALIREQFDWGVIVPRYLSELERLLAAR